LRGQSGAHDVVAGGGLVNSGSVLVLQQAGWHRPAATSWPLELPLALRVRVGGTAQIQEPPARS